MKVYMDRRHISYIQRNVVCNLTKRMLIRCFLIGFI